MWNQRRLLLLAVGVLVLLLLLAVNLGYRIAFGNLEQSLDDQLGDQLAGTAESLADGITPDVRTGVVGGHFNVSAYLRVHDLLETFAAGNGLVSVELLDTLWNDPFADDTDSLSHMVRSLLDEEGHWAVMAGLTWVSPTFRWGTTFYRSAAAPIVSESGNGTIAIVRIEVDAGYFQSINTLRRLAWWIHGSSGVFAALLIVLFAWYARRSREWEAKLLHTEKLIGLGRLAATIAHEIKNPLGIIRATAQRLERVDDPEKRKQLLGFIPEETERLNRILTGYLRIASPEPQAPVAVAVHLELLHWMTHAYEGHDDTRGRWTAEVKDAGWIRVDPDAPRQILTNLVNNALDVSPVDKRVAVYWGPGEEGFARLTVEDSGPGIPKRLRDSVFEPFYTTKVKGSGLGLYAVQMLVERDGGAIRIEDSPDGGARFIVEWPRSNLSTRTTGES